MRVVLLCVGVSKWCQNEKVGPHRESNPGPLAPEARIIPLDHAARINVTGYEFHIPHKINNTTTNTTKQTQHTPKTTSHTTPSHRSVLPSHRLHTNTHSVSVSVSLLRHNQPSAVTPAPTPQLMHLRCPCCPRYAVVPWSLPSSSRSSLLSRDKR